MVAFDETSVIIHEDCIVCETGWWLSMKPEDQFLKKLQPLSDRHTLVRDDDERFGTYNDKTIGFLLVGAILRFYLITPYLKFA